MEGRQEGLSTRPQSDRTLVMTARVRDRNPTRSLTVPPTDHAIPEGAHGSVHGQASSHTSRGCEGLGGRLEDRPFLGMTPRDVSVAIPTFQRESVLIDTLEALQASGAGEILVVDQTPTHEPRTETRLREMDQGGRIRWLRLTEPSIPRAMNVALLEAHTPAFPRRDIEPATSRRRRTRRVMATISRPGGGGPGLQPKNAEALPNSLTWHFLTSV